VNATVVRYRVKPGRAEENAELVRAVYAELTERQPPGFRYTTFVAPDGLTFVHIAFGEDGHDVPLTGLATFALFTSAIAERCDVPPEVTQLPSQVGSYGL
jgi:hypothetical protein